MLTKQVDWQAEQPSQVACALEDLEQWAWDAGTKPVTSPHLSTLKAWSRATNQPNITTQQTKGISSVGQTWDTAETWLQHWDFWRHHHHHHHFDLSLNCEGRWGTTDDFTTSFLHFPLFSTAVWSRTSRPPGLSIPWCCLPTSSSVCLVFYPLLLCLARWFWPDLMNGRHDHTTAVCISLWWSGGFVCCLWWADWSSRMPWDL